MPACERNCENCPFENWQEVMDKVQSEGVRPNSKDFVSDEQDRFLVMPLSEIEKLHIVFKNGIATCKKVKKFGFVWST